MSERPDPLEMLSRRESPELDPPDDRAARIRARMVAALHDEAEDASDVVVLRAVTDSPDTGDVDEVEVRGGSSARWLRPFVAVAAAAAIVLGVVFVSAHEPTSQDDVAPAGTPALEAPDSIGEFVLRDGSAWAYSATVEVGEDSSLTIGTDVIVTDLEEAGAQTVAVTRVRVDSLVSAMQGSARIVAGADSLRLPPALLDPRAGLVDCAPGRGVEITSGDAGIDVSPIDDLACSDRISGTDAVVRDERRIATPFFSTPISATPVELRWTLDGAERATTWWVAPGSGVVRIDVDSPDGTRTTHELVDRQTGR